MRTMSDARHLGQRFVSTKQLKELQDKLATTEKVKAKNEQNKIQSIGSVTGNAGGGESDAFLLGLGG